VRGAHLRRLGEGAIHLALDLLLVDSVDDGDLRDDRYFARSYIFFSRNERVLRALM